jgi:SAM-dependent methyltransferase
MPMSGIRNEALESVVAGYGPWIRENGEWVRRGENLPETRLRRVLQVAADLIDKPLDSCRVLDLGCLDGQFSVEFALHGATVTGLDARAANLARANAAKELLGLDRLEFELGDARNISADRLGRFDVIVCSGLLYHLDVPDVFHIVERMYDMVDRLLIVDTHISLAPALAESFGGQVYHGHRYVEHDEGDPADVKAARALASWENRTSFVLTRPSLVNLLQHVGFSSVYECLSPPHLNYGKPGLEHRNRCAFVAVKGRPLPVHTSPAATRLKEYHPEDSLTYPIRRQGSQSGRSLARRLRKWLSRRVASR